MSAEPPRAGSSIDDDTVVGPIRNRPLRSHSLALLAARLRSPDGLDRETLARIEQLTGDEQ